jgi:hypothetical protein
MLSVDVDRVVTDASAIAVVVRADGIGRVVTVVVVVVVENDSALAAGRNACLSLAKSWKEA